MKRPCCSNLKIAAALVVVFLIALGLRLYGYAWDAGIYLNPDERFLAMVANGLKLPQSLAEYFNPAKSLMNPYNTGNGFFVYGHFPLTLAKILAVNWGFDNYGQFFKLTRPLSALTDASVTLALFVIAKRLFRKVTGVNKVGILSGLVYALLVFPIQQAHFFTTDSFVNAFFVWSLCFTLYSSLGVRYLVLSAIAYGLGQASKISMAYTLPLILGTMFLENRKSLRLYFGYLLLFGCVSYLTLRITDPYLFGSSNFLDPRPAKQFVENLIQLKSFDKGITFPPIVQWHNTGFLFPLKNIFFFGTGIIFFLLSLAGYTKSFKKQFSLGILILLGFWTVGFYTYLSLQVAKTMRYFIFLYPFIALFAGYFLAELKRFPRVVMFLLAIVWTVAFMRVYSVTHSRIQATNWINQTIKPGSTIIWEHWDDPLPLYQIPGRDLKVLPNNFYEPDSPEKWRLLAKKFRFVDYLVLSSNRQTGSIGKAPELFPIGARYYQKLQNEELGFKRVATFVVYPALAFGKFKLEFPDQWAEEAFTVFDHPLVQIYRKTPHYSPKKFLRTLNVD